MEQLQLTLKPTDDIDIGSYFKINLEDENGREISLRSEFVKQRTQNNQIEVGGNLDQTMDNMARALALDYQGLFDIEEANVSNIILRSRPPMRFVDAISFNPVRGTPILDFTPIYFPVNNIRIESVEYSPASSAKCSKCVVRVEFSRNADAYCLGSSCFPISEDFAEFEVFRGSNHIFRVMYGTYMDEETLSVPQSLQSLSNSIYVNVVNAPSGSTAQVISTDNNLQLQYSLNNEDWQDENYFSGLIEGEYTVYIRDYLGCEITKTFTATPNVNAPSNRTSAYHLVSKSNSIRYAKRDNFNFVHKTDENTLSCESDVLMPYKQIQLFKSEDIIATQFQSNYDNNEAYVLVDDQEEQIPVLRKTNNMGLKDRRSALKYNLENGKTGIYFITGDVLNYDTGVVIDQYELNGYLPEWGKQGNYISVDGAWFQIEKIIFDSLKNADVIVINNVYLGIETNTVVGCEYNRENFEVYEFSINMEDYANKKIQSKIKMYTGSQILRYEESIYVSEEIHVTENQENTVEIRYKNSKNTDILYSTGIEHLLRIPIEIVSGNDITSSDNHKSDTSTILLDSDVYEANKFKFEPQTKELWRKLLLALSHDIVYIDSVGYVKEGDFETEGPLGQTNLYSLTANMIKTGKEYQKNQLRRVMPIDVNLSELPDVVGLLPYDSNGYISR